MLTEDEARKKLCPMARDNAVWAGTFTCIASGCMAWRSGRDTSNVIDRIQEETGKTRVELIKEYRIRTGAGLQDAMDAVNAEFPPRQVGYCGAFGRPGDTP